MHSDTAHDGATVFSSSATGREHAALDSVCAALRLWTEDAAGDRALRAGVH